ILFGIAPCAVALSQSRRDLFRLFLKRSSGSPRLERKPLSVERTKGSEILFGIAPGAAAPRGPKAMARGVPVHHVERRELDALCRGQVHQGVCLEATPLRFKSLEEAEKPDLGDEESPNRQLVWLVLEEIQDPMNLGALLRSAYFLGVDRVVTSRRNSCPLTPTVSKASSGAMEAFDVYSTDDLRSFLKAKTAEGWEVVGTVSKPEDVENVPVISCSEFRWNKPILIVIGELNKVLVTALTMQAASPERLQPVCMGSRLLARRLLVQGSWHSGYEALRFTLCVQACCTGNEGDGLSLETQLLCHRMLAIPPGRALHPGIESLNVSVATGILLHSICSRKLSDGD
ncbi:PREDICTED: rRNA methyltransferase 1, mitochondrial, partial [Tauraco erythrolophus]|uniref:rRNA methyltransferase 1, mitochondrial n=1 Tax=Tauraco erythrolophus TaxID=121530 RepID=UPI000523C1DE